MTTLDKEIELLRKRAEAALAHAPAASGATPEGMVDALRLVEELRVYQTELEIQNQDLRAAQLQTEAAMRKYRRVFANLPLESLIVDAQGFIVEANALARKRFSLHQQTALQRRSVYQLFAFSSRSNLYATLSNGVDVASASQCRLMADESGESSDVDVHLITLDPASLVDDERLMVLVDRTYERRLAAQHDELRRSEARHRALFDGSQVPMLLIEPGSGHIVRCNEAAVHFYGADEKTLQGKVISDINCLSPDEIRAEMNKARDELREHFFFTHRVAGGRTAPVEVHSGPIEMDGRILLYSIVHDISDRVAAQKKADASLALLTNLAAQLPGVVYQLQVFPDGRTCLPYASRALRDIFELTPDDVRTDASAVFATVHPDDHKVVTDSIAESGAHLTAWHCEYRVVLPKQGERWRRGDATPERLADGSILWHGFITDITTEHQIRLALRENERILRTSIEAIDEGFVLYDSQDRLVFCNEKYKDIYATSADLLVAGANFEDMLRMGAQRGQYADATGRIEAWVAERMAAHRSGDTTITQRLDSGRVLRILERRTEDGYTVGFRVDVTAIANATEAALTANRHYEYLLSAASEISIISTDRQGLIRVFNRGAERMLGYSADEVVGKLCASAFHVAQEVKHRQQELSAEMGIPVAGFNVFTAKADVDGQEHREWTYVRKDGEHFQVSLVVTAVRSQSGKITGYLGISQDISKRKLAESSMQLASKVFTHTREGILITNADNLIVSVNAAFTRITGYEAGEVMGRNPNMFKSGRQSPAFYSGMWASLNSMGYWEGEIWNRRKDGEVYAEWLCISVVRDGNRGVVNYVALLSDISAQKEHELALEHIARYDALTGLPNRVLLADRLQQEMAHCLRRRKLLAVVFIDLDGFKQVNDLHGHGIGDELLVTLSHRMKAALREGDTLSRIGGDEFVAVLTGLDQPKDCELVLTRLLQSAADPVVAGEFVLRVSASIGVTLFPQDAADADQLLRHADHAMYQAKQAGKNRYHYFDVKDDAAFKVHRESLEEVSAALDHEEFVLHYQPKVNMKTGAVIGMEALIRWEDPRRNMLVLPAGFLPLIKGHPLSIRLGDWVIRTALAQISAWNALGIHLSVSVNIDALHLQQGTFLATLVEALAAYPGARPEQLDLEVLETSAMDDIENVTTIMRECCALGVGFSLDDFGTGYSSLTYLKRLPAELMKIDQSFVIGMVTDSDDFVIVEGVIGLARAFGRNVLAEGVETVAHGELLLALGCELAQGFGIARAMPAADVPGWVRNWLTDPGWSIWNEPARALNSRDMVLAEIKHRHWLRDVENYVTGKSEVLPPLGVDNCQLGVWITSSDAQRYTGEPAFATMTQAHAAVHQKAQQLVALFDAGNHTRARQELAGLTALRDALIVAVRRLGSAEEVAA